jgi:hypothetical protein
VQIPSPFEEKEPPRRVSPGETYERFADLAVMGVRLFLGLEMSLSERAALVTLLGLYHRWQNRK